MALDIHQLMSSIEQLRSEIQAFDAVTWASSGEPTGTGDALTPGWVRFRLDKSELGWRTLEFLAWVFEDLIRAGRQLTFFPTSGPPYLNTPGETLAFAVECYMDGAHEGGSIGEVTAFLRRCRMEHWAACAP